MPKVLVDLLSYTGTKGGMETYARELYRAIGALDGDEIGTATGVHHDCVPRAKGCRKLALELSHERPHSKSTFGYDGLKIRILSLIP